VTAVLAHRPAPEAADATAVVWKLRLYVAGQSPKSLHATSNLRRLCDEHLAGRFDIEIIDLEEQPERARLDNIIAIPTLVRCAPAPLRRTIGDLSDTGRVLAALDLPRGLVP
jgi:circadian clock protein KaiB